MIGAYMEHSRHIQAKALVLKHYTSGEFDRRVVIFAENMGKVTARARGARKITSPFAGRLSPINFCDLLLYRTPKNTWTITEFRTINIFEKIKKNLEKSEIGLRIMEIVHRCTEAHHANNELLSLSMETLEMLEKLPEKKHGLLFMTFQVKVLETLGLLPSFSSCSICHRKINMKELEKWHPTEIFCHPCKSKAGALTVSFPKNQLKLLSFIKKNSIRETLKIALASSEGRTLNEILRIFWSGQTFSLPKSIDALSMPRA